MFPNSVILTDPGHIYTHTIDGIRYKSVSKVIERYKNKFDTEKMSYLSARKKLRELGKEPSEEQILIKKAELKLEWKAKNDLACRVGGHVHDCLEVYGKSTKIKDPKLETMIRGIYSQYVEYKKIFSEQILYSEEDEVAGTADKVMLRPKTKNTIDIDDYKTNISQGIATSNKYGNFMLAPFSYLEDCNFIHYTLQLSIYAAMVEKQGYKIGRLRIVYIPPSNPLAFRFIPVPYMKFEASMMLASHLNKEHVDSLMTVDE